MENKMKDPLFHEAIKQWNKYGKGYKKPTASFFQRRLDIGYLRAFKLMRQLENEGAISSPQLPLLGRKLAQLRQYAQTHPKAFTIWLVVATLALVFLIKDFWGVKQVGHFFERSGEYETTAYVSIFNNRDDVKNYKVRAEIERSDHGDEESTERITRLNKAYFPSGGYVTFEEFYCELELDKKVYCRDDNLKDWYIELHP